ncbi:flavin reductase family protein [Nocardiopsis sp. ATB16-24]|uniref:flavin reductase family protein n=1 Tax=Nocardiopsis sp. ATB16-24 TaxID=3019555 RepID=UPI0025552D4A|nr:flavin reductase family protein [Nocardiopsis sp. ATB16-24]
MPLSSRTLLGIPKTNLRGTSWAIPSGVSIVSTISADGDLYTVTVSSLTTASLEPPLVVFYLKRVSRSLHAVRDGGEFAVTVLAAHQDSVALRFSAPGLPRGSQGWKGIPLRPAPVTGLLIAVEGVAYFDCCLVSCFEVGDHQSILGRMLSCDGLEPSASFLHGNSEFTMFRDAGSPTVD